MVYHHTVIGDLFHGHSRFSTLDNPWAFQSLRSISHDWVRSLYDEMNWETMTAILLLLIPNIETIKIMTRTHDFHHIGCILRNASKLQMRSAESQFSFPNLAAMSICFWYDDGDEDDNENEEFVSITIISKMLQIPSLRSFACRAIGDVGSITEHLALPICLESLTLTRCGMQTCDFRRLIDKCESLKHIRFGFSKTGGNIRLNPAEFFRSFDHLHHHQLESLTVEDETEWLRNGLEDADLTPIPPISGFTKLHTIDITSDFLLGRDILIVTTIEEQGFSDEECNIRTSRPFTLADLPSSLVHLTLRNAYAAVMMEHISELKMHELPNLNSVYVEFHNSEACNVDGGEWSSFGTSLFRQRRVRLSSNFNEHSKSFEERAGYFHDQHNKSMALR